jgi:AAA+ ATPase superfamily predicted ATPase
MKTPQTPFPTVGYYGPEYFCDRDEETKKLLININGGHSITLTAIRRIGKTGLIKHLLYNLSKDWICIYVDILATENLNTFLNYLATAIINAVPEKSSIGKKIWKAILKLRPLITYDTLTGEPGLSFSVSHEESKLHIEGLFGILENQENRVVIAIDEFQQILSYPEQNVDSWLRTKIQHFQNTVFIFSGSRQHLMNDLFSNPSRPFFRSTTFFNLDKIDLEIYCQFIIEKFALHRKTISKQNVMEILEWTNIHTYYVQLLCNRVFLNSGKNVITENWHQEASKLLKEQEFVFFTYRDMLTKHQWNLLKGIALEKYVYSPTAKEFIRKYELGSSASVLRSLESLENKELIYLSYDKSGNSFYSVYDVLFQRWIETI